MVLFGRAALRIEYSVSMFYVVFQRGGNERDSKMGDKDVEQASMTDQQQPSDQEEQSMDVFEAPPNTSAEEKRIALGIALRRRLLVIRQKLGSNRRLRQGQSLSGGDVSAMVSGHRCKNVFMFFIKVKKTCLNVF